MQKALMLQHGVETIVSAADLSADYHGHIPSGFRFLCPLCRQPLFPAAMTPGGKQSPHFRHKNSERAHECELYERSYGDTIAYHRMTLPLFIRRSKDSDSKYVVEGGFRRLSQEMLSRLEAEEARIVLGQREYLVTNSRFDSALTKLPFDDLTLSMKSAVILKNSSLSLAETWGYPEEATKAMVFSRDVASKQGRRIKRNEGIPLGSDLYLLCPSTSGRSLKEAFPETKSVGYVGSRSSYSKLVVYEASLPELRGDAQRCITYLEECGYEVVDAPEAPQLIWPPALLSGGEIIPLFAKSPCIFTVSSIANPKESLCVRSEAGDGTRFTKVRLSKTQSPGNHLAILSRTTSLSFITTGTRTCPDVLLHPNEGGEATCLRHANPGAKIEGGSDKEVLVTLNSPAEVALLKRGTPPGRLKSPSDGCHQIRIPIRDFEVLRVLVKLDNYPLDTLAILDYATHTHSSTDDSTDRGPAQRRAVVAHSAAPDDLRRAEGRNLNGPSNTNGTHDKCFAATRKALR